MAISLKLNVHWWSRPWHHLVLGHSALPVYTERRLWFQKITLWNPSANVCGFRVTSMPLSCKTKRMNHNKSVAFDAKACAIYMRLWFSDFLYYFFHGSKVRISVMLRVTLSTTFFLPQRYQLALDSSGRPGIPCNRIAHWLAFRTQIDLDGRKLALEQSQWLVYLHNVTLRDSKPHLNKWYGPLVAIEITKLRMLGSLLWADEVLY